jgi:hypothetical protein
MVDSLPRSKGGFSPCFTSAVPQTNRDCDISPRLREPLLFAAEFACPRLTRWLVYWRTNERRITAMPLAVWFVCVSNVLTEEFVIAGRSLPGQALTVQREVHSCGIPDRTSRRLLVRNVRQLKIAA